MTLPERLSSLCYFVHHYLSFCPFCFVHCVVCSSSIYGFWLPLWYLLSIVLSVRLRYTDSDYLFEIFNLFLINYSCKLFDMIVVFNCRQEHSCLKVLCISSHRMIRAIEQINYCIKYQSQSRQPDMEMIFR